LIGVIHVPVQDEGVDAVEVRHFPPRRTPRRRLVALAVGTIGAMKALLGKNDAPGLAGEAQIFAGEKSREDFEVFESDAWRVVREESGFVPPEARVAEVLGIGMMRDVPGEIAAFT